MKQCMVKVEIMVLVPSPDILKIKGNTRVTNLRKLHFKKAK